MRQVQFDPYGSYTEGLDRGMGRQMELEQQSRANRQTDWEYNNVNPYKLNALQRNDQLGAFALPKQKNAIDYADTMGRNNAFDSTYRTDLSLAGDWPGFSTKTAGDVSNYGNIQYQQDLNQPGYSHYYIPDRNGAMQYGGVIGTDVLAQIAKHKAEIDDFYKTQQQQASINATNGMANFNYNRGQTYAPGGARQGSMAAREKYMQIQGALDQARMEYQQELLREKQQANGQGAAQGNSYTNTGAGADQTLPPPDMTDFMPGTP